MNDRGESWRYTSSSGSYGIKRPSAASDTTTVTYTALKVSSVTAEGVTSNYSFADAAGVRTATVTAPDAAQTVVKSAIATGLVSSMKDPLLHETTYTYDSYGRPSEVRQPEGNKIVYAYDGRGNVTSTTAKAKTTAPATDIVLLASFPSTCANPLTCNLPTWVKDGKGNQTDYVYDNATGLTTSITSPAPTTGGVRPQVRYSYSALQANYKNSSGVVVPSGLPVTKLVSISQCQTGATCPSTVDEVKSSVTYDDNLLPSSISAGAGDGSLTATTVRTYDDVGNIKTVDGPLAGADDTTSYRYAPGRRLVGVIAPDPDGAGVLKRRAVKANYNADGQIIVSELGTVNGVSDPDWAAFNSLQQTTATYDANARRSKDVVTASGTTYQVTQYGYDGNGRLECSALRMNSAIWGALPSSACTPGTTGGVGADRITKSVYDADGRTTKVQTALGTSEAADEVTGTYTDNGQTATLTDAEGNKTTYEYDGFDRLLKTRYPVPTAGSGTSSATDYEQLGYDANSAVTSRRLRDNSSINYAYDALGRLTNKDLPSTEPDTFYTYDLLGRMTASGSTAQTLYFSYDALGRNLTQSGPVGTVSSQYDLAGRRTRLTWPDSFYVDYDYDVTGNVTKIREYGATTGAGVLATYAYDDLGNRTNLTRGNGTTTTYTPDPVSRLSSLEQNLTGTTNDLTLGFVYNPASQIKGVTRTNNNYSWTGSVNVDRAYTVNGLNQVTSSGGVALGYDARGNLNSSGTTSYVYSSENLLQSSSGNTLSYDPLLRLFQINSTTRLGYDGQDLIGEWTTAGVLQKRYVHGPGSDEPLVWYNTADSSDRRWLHTDERGSVIAVTDVTGAVIGTNTYDEYGIPGSGNIGRFQYTGQTWLSEIGLYYYKARMYSATLGRFMQTDPIGYGDGMNWYNYVDADPVNLVDPLGLTDEGDIIVCSGILMGDRCLSRYTVERWLRSLQKSAGPSSSGGRGGVARAQTLPQDAQRKDDPDCKQAMSENGTIVYSGVTGTLIVGGGITGSWGTFTNQTTGTQGSYWSIGGGGGADIGGGAQLGYSRNIRLFVGGSVSGNISALGVGGSASGALSQQGVTYSGLSGSVAPGPWKFGASVTGAGTKVYSCTVSSH